MKKVPKKKKANTKGKSKQIAPDDYSWLSLRSGMRIVIALSILVGIWVSWQAIPIKGLLEGVFWGIVFGGSIWAFFLVALLFNRWTRRS